MVILSVYNGTRFLEEQLISLMNQENVDCFLLVRDDGSSDNSLEILKRPEYKELIVKCYSGPNLGLFESFMFLLREARIIYPLFDFYAFCDQDDVWMPDKLHRACNILGSNNAKIKLYFSSFVIVDENLVDVKISNNKYSLDFSELFVQLNSLGCTQVFSFDLMSKLVDLNIGKVYSGSPLPNHDGWLYITAHVFNAEIFYDQEPTILYRQHGNNVVGSRSGMSSRFYWLKNQFYLRSRIASIILDLFNDIDSDKRVFLDHCVAANHSMKSRIFLLKSMKNSKNYYLKLIIFRILIILRIF